jgi:hypothetical protein
MVSPSWPDRRRGDDPGRRASRSERGGPGGTGPADPTVRLRSSSEDVLGWVEGGKAARGSRPSSPGGQPERDSARSRTRRSNATELSLIYDLAAAIGGSDAVEPVVETAVTSCRACPTTQACPARRRRRAALRARPDGEAALSTTHARDRDRRRGRRDRRRGAGGGRLADSAPPRPSGRAGAGRRGPCARRRDAAPGATSRAGRFARGPQGGHRDRRARRPATGGRRRDAGRRSARWGRELSPADRSDPGARADRSPAADARRPRGEPAPAPRGARGDQRAASSRPRTTRAPVELASRASPAPGLRAGAVGPSTMPSVTGFCGGRPPGLGLLLADSRCPSTRWPSPRSRPGRRPAHVRDAASDGGNRQRPTAPLVARPLGTPSDPGRVVGVLLVADTHARRPWRPRTACCCTVGSLPRVAWSRRACARSSRPRTASSRRGSPSARRTSSRP